MVGVVCSSPTSSLVAALHGHYTQPLVKYAKRFQFYKRLAFSTNRFPRALTRTTQSRFPESVWHPERLRWLRAFSVSQLPLDRATGLRALDGLNMCLVLGSGLSWA